VIAAHLLRFPRQVDRIILDLVQPKNPAATLVPVSPRALSDARSASRRKRPPRQPQLEVPQHVPPLDAAHDLVARQQQEEDNEGEGWKWAIRRSA
jgi:hypothetical protein